MDFDFVVIGAGPIGSYLSELLASDNYSVALFESKEEVGKDVICSGIIGEEPYREYGLPEDAIISKISDISVYSPSKIEFRYSRDEPFAYVADRETLDRILFSRAISEGVEPFLGNTVIDLYRDGKKVKVKYQENGGQRMVGGKCVIIATGSTSTLHKKAGLMPPKRFFGGGRVEFDNDKKKEGPIELYILNSPSKGSYGWVIPLNNKTRIGMVSEKYDRTHFCSFIDQFEESVNIPKEQIKEKPIAYGGARKIAGENVIAVGEAAGQVKTTTGGGIHYGLIGVKIAHQVLSKAVKANDFSANRLFEYEELWRKGMEKELKAGMILRNVTSNIPSTMIDIVFKRVGKDPLIQDKLDKIISFNYHRGFIDFWMNLLLHETCNLRKQ
ncbi:NAD(P)/FAD-dependent oxidoreductase [candidate division WOR-3 bacterium]|nr:NAD(P)/FAD-dependent oxidoreductase [candidate division WOR-3 bacterium]